MTGRPALRVVAMVTFYCPDYRHTFLIGKETTLFISYLVHADIIIGTGIRACGASNTDIVIDDDIAKFNIALDGTGWTIDKIADWLERSVACD